MKTKTTAPVGTSHSNGGRLPAARRKETLLLAARTIVFEEGPGRFTTRRLAERVGLTEAAIYKHFPDKERIWVELIHFLFQGWEEKLQKLVAKPVSASRKLEEIALFHFSHLIDNQFNPVLLLSETVGGDRIAVRQAFMERGGKISDAVEAIIRDGCASGVFHHELDVAAAVLGVFGVLQGTLIRWTLQSSSRGLKRDLVGTMRLLLRAFEASPRAG